MDEFSKNGLALEIAFSLPALVVIRVLDAVAAIYGYPKFLRVDNGPELASIAMMNWAYEHDVQLLFIQPGKPTQNAFIESFNSRVREEFFNANGPVGAPARGCVAARACAASSRSTAPMGGPTPSTRRRSRHGAWHRAASSLFGDRLREQLASHSGMDGGTDALGGSQGRVCGGAAGGASDDVSRIRPGRCGGRRSRVGKGGVAAFGRRGRLAPSAVAQRTAGSADQRAKHSVATSEIDVDR
jgi:transposase InsO family protein